MRLLRGDGNGLRAPVCNQRLKRLLCILPGQHVDKGNPEAMVLMRVAGDSMQPEILDGDVVLLDQSKKDIMPGRIFAVGFDDSIYLKRIDKQPGKVILKSVNEEAYPPIELDIRGDMAEYFRVIGKVVWSGREYR